jgi:5-methylcytosine-specific restriction endonuclease McrA
MSSRHYYKAVREIIAELTERDGYNCGICGFLLQPARLQLEAGNKWWAPSIDHIIPRSKGGDNALTNLQLAHAWCNSTKSNWRILNKHAWQALAIKRGIPYYLQTRELKALTPTERDRLDQLIRERRKAQEAFRQLENALMASGFYHSDQFMQYQHQFDTLREALRG